MPKYSLPIPKDIMYHCPNCKREAWHQCTIYTDHETRKCKTCGHEWSISFTAYGADFDVRVREETQKLADLCNEIMLDMSGRRTKMQEEKVKLGLGLLKKRLDNFLQVVPKTEEEEELERHTITARSQDYPYMFRREHMGRRYEGVVFCSSQAEAKASASYIRRAYRVSAISYVISPSAEYQERYLVMLPRDPEGIREAGMIAQAKEYLESMERIAQPPVMQEIDIEVL